MGKTGAREAIPSKAMPEEMESGYPQPLPIRAREIDRLRNGGAAGAIPFPDPASAP
jgi:hypothetical protein